MTAPITTFRTTVVDGVATVLGIASKVPGRVDGPIEDLSIVCSWPLSIAETPGLVSTANTAIVVRVLLPRKLRRMVAEAIDPTALEAAAAAVHAWAAAHASPATSWFARCTSTDFDQDAYRVDFTFVGRGSNPAGGGA